MTASARYHARRKARLHARLGRSCFCGSQERLQVAHLAGDGWQRRAERGNAGEITRLLGLADEELHEQVALMCAPCHREHDLAAGHLEWRTLVGV